MNISGAGRGSTKQASTAILVNRKPKISIAMATFEGGRYLVEQFNSLREQTRLPDEIIIYDDASSDNTMAILKEIEKTVPFRIEIIEGKTNRGVNYAFETASAACRGDYIFFCDQDDYWEPEKIDKFVSVFESNAAVGMVFCDASEFDADGRSVSSSLWNRISFSQKRRQNFEIDPVAELLQKGNFVYGMAVAFRADAIRPFYPISADSRGMTHDTWFAIHVMAAGWTGTVIDEQLVRYRRHVNQATSRQLLDAQLTRKAILKAKRERELLLREALRKVAENVAIISSDEFRSSRLAALQRIDAKVSHISLREEVRSNRNIFVAAQATFSKGYWRHARGVLSVLSDLHGMQKAVLIDRICEFRNRSGGKRAREI